jgi:ATP-dependent Clp protease ATP-binding subunit ClpA
MCDESVIHSLITFRCFHPIKALERRFQQVYIGEPSPEDTVSILRGLKPKYEVHHGVRIRDEALLAAAKLSSRYLPDRYLPDKAIGKWIECMFTLYYVILTPLLT